MAEVRVRRVVAASVASVALLGAVCVAPASALSDVAVDGAGASDVVMAGAGVSEVDGGRVLDGPLTSASVGAGAGAAPVSTGSGGLRAQPVADGSAADAMPGNPDAALPGQVSASVGDDATVVSESHALTDDGELRDIETGETVTDPELVGTVGEQPDPLAKTDGGSFIPVSAAEVREKVAANGGDVEAGADDDAARSGKADDGGAGGDDAADATEGDADAGGSGAVGGSDGSVPGDAAASGAVSYGASGTSGNAALAVAGEAGTVAGTAGSAGNGIGNTADAAAVRPASLPNNSYGAHWGSYNGTPAFFESNGNLFVQQAKGVVDVSEWQGDIDWQAARNAGVEGAIIRIGYGWGNGLDRKAQRNINECKRLGIPFGVYVYSYAYDASTAAKEGSNLVGLLRQAGVNPGDLGYPVYYDLEAWAWTGHAHPTSPAVYEGMVDAWYGQLQSAGYGDLSVYSYTSYLNTALNSGRIHARTRWVAQYGARMQYTAWPTNDRGWQYTSDGVINGINGKVDLNAFGVARYDANRENVIKPAMQVKDIQEGDYYIGSAFSNRYIGIAGNSMSNLAGVEIQQPDNADNQLFHIAPIGNGAYSITAKSSGKSLDIEGASMENGTSIVQFDLNGGDNQKWYFYRNADGYMYIVSAYGESRNKVIDVTAASSMSGTRLELWSANGGPQQQFRLLQKVVFSGSQAISSAFSTGRNLDVKTASNADGAVLDVWTASDAANQRFVFEDKGNGLYAIRAKHSNKYLDIYGAYQGDGGRLIQYYWTGAANQLWYLQRDKNKNYVILSSLNNKAVDIEGMSKSNGASVITYRYNSQSNQKWNITKSEPKPAMVDWSKYGSDDSVVADGDYFIESAFLGHYVSKSAGRAVIHQAADESSQLYRLKKLSNGNYMILSESNSEALAVASSAPKNGDLIEWKSSSETDEKRQWKLYKDKNGLYFVVSAIADKQGKVLDVPAMNTKDNTALNIWDVNGGDQQRFRLLKKASIPGVYAVLSDYAKGNRLDVTGMSPYSGAEIETWGNTGGANQRFTFIYKGHGLYAIKVQHSGLVLDVDGMNVDDGAQVIQYPWSGGRNQLWYLKQRLDGEYIIASAMNNKVLDIYGMQKTPGGHVIMYRDNGQANQRWQLRRNQYDK